jgi:glycine/D-amino acid oxidase-like deaminating enzyme
MGASIAYNLAKSGSGTVVLLEKSTISNGASGVSHGNTPQYYTIEPMARMTAKSWKFFRDFDMLVENASPVYHRVGMMYAYPERLAPKWEKNVSSQKRYGLFPSILDSAEIKGVAPEFFQEKFYGACYEEDGGFVDSRTAVQGLVEASRTFGTRLFQHTTVTGLEREKDNITAVLTERGTIRTPAVICACGAWTRPLLNTAGMDLPIMNSWAGLCTLKRPDSFKGEHMTLIDYVNFSSVHAQDSHFTDIGIFEPTIEMYSQSDLSIDPDDHEDTIPLSKIDAFLERGSLYPGLENAAFRGSYACVSDDSPDYQPIIGEMPGVSGIYVAAGFSGQGFKIAPSVGEVMCDIALNKKASAIDVDMLNPSRFQEHKLIKFDPLFDVA